MLYLLLFLDIIFMLSIFYVKRYIIHFIELQFQKDQSYQSEKGKNLATKEDIQEITANIEIVKNEISFEKQRNHDFIKERERRFLNILFYAETIANSINRLYVYGHNTQEASRVHTLIDEISKAALLMRQESSVCIAAYNDVIGDDKVMTNLVDNIQLLSVELLTKANNVANNIAFFKQMFDKTQSEEGKNKDDAFTKAMMIGWQNNQLLDEPVKYKDAVNNNIEQYLLWLNRLYMGGLAINYKVELIHIGKDKQNKKSINIPNGI